MRRNAVEAVAWPAIGGLVKVVGAEEQPWAGELGVSSRVEDLDDTRVAIAAPSLPAGVPVPLEGEGFDLVWATPRGLQVYPVQLVDRGHDGLTLWWCELSGSTVLRQRRAYVRAQSLAAWPVHVTLRWPGPPGGCVEGVLVDVSEGGLRVRVAEWSGGEDVRVTITVVLAEGAAEGMAGGLAGAALTGHELRGTVLRQAAPAASGVVDVGVQLDQPVPPADDLRALVFAWQRAGRRAGLE